MANLNPFLEEDDLDESVATSPELERKKTESKEYSLDVIAEELIKHKYILTALELYTEIQERGKDLHRLRNYFSNPSNFDLPVNFKDTSVGAGLYRTTSTSTFDSLDITRFSDEGGQVDERIAVLEFELRKAKDTIKSLRANLTETAEQQSSCLQENNSSFHNGDLPIQSVHDVTQVIKPLELRAINYLVNEHLLHHNYKLSSITFSDENAEQDFEDWDDVGINTAKPPGLLQLYRDYSNHAIPTLQTNNASTETDDFDIKSADSGVVSEEIEELQRELEFFKKENEQLHLTIDELQRDMKEITEAKKEESVPSTNNDTESQVVQSSAVDESQETPTSLRIENVNILRNDTTANQPEPSRMPKMLWEALLIEMQSSVEESWLKDAVLNVSGSTEELVLLLGRCLPHIVPTVLLAKRDQLVPLILATAALHTDPSVRYQLLHIMFNLIKKPDSSQRQIILHGCTGYARHVGFDRTEEDLLPQFWEQLGHKYPERRQLVAESCGVIAPYLRAEMRGSLLISILLQMQQEEKLDEVKCSVVKSLASVYAFVDDDGDKYTQAFQLLSSFLDGGSSVREAAYLYLLPSIAMWAIHRGSIHSHLCHELMKRLEEAVHEKKEDGAFNDAVPIMYLLPYLFVASLFELEEEGDEIDVDEERCSYGAKRKLDDPVIIIGSHAALIDGIRRLDSALGKVNVNNRARVLLWMTNFFLPRLLNMLASISPDFIEGVASLAELMDLFCKLFGKTYVEEKIARQFVEVFENSSEHLSTSMLPVYISSVLPLLQDDRTLISDFLFKSIVKLSVAQFSTENVKLALILLRCKPQYHDVIIQFLWSAVMHESSLVRATAASLLVVMTTSDVDVKVISSRVLPALITLSTDEKTNVRVATVSSFCHIMANQSVEIGLVERVITQLTEVATSSVEMSYDEHSQDGTLLGLHSVQSTLANLVTQIGAVFHPKFRDDFILPHLVIVAASNNQCGDLSKRSVISLELLEAYTCLSCCFITSSLLQGSVLPALHFLRADIEALQPKRIDDVNGLISEVERKLEQGSVTSDGSPQPRRASSSSGNSFRLSSAQQLGHVFTTGADDAKRKFLSTLDQLKRK